MKNIFLTLVAVTLFIPFAVSADSYDGPFCFEDPSMDSMEEYRFVGIRGTCKKVEVSSIVSLDASLQNDYLLAQHTPIEYCDGWPCETTKYSEIIQLATTTNLTFTDSDISRSYEDTAILLDKKYVLDYISSIYKKSGEKLEDNKYPEIILMNHDEMKKIGDSTSNVGYSYNEILAVFSGRNIPLIINRNDSLTNSDPILSIATFDYSEFGKHIYSLKGTLAEQHYLDFDKTKLPPLNIERMHVYKGHYAHIIPITSPVKSIKNYWLFTKKNGKVVLAWQKSEYGLDNEQVKIITRTDKNVGTIPLFSDGLPVSAETTSSLVSTSSASSTSTVSGAVEQKKGFFSRLFTLILSWVR